MCKPQGMEKAFRHDIELTEWKCDEVPEKQFLYSDKEIHWTRIQKHTCLADGCNDKTVFPDLTALTKHWVKECKDVTIKCGKCLQYLKRGDLPKHDCVQALKERNAQLRKYERDLQAIREDLEPEEKGGKYQRCYLGHVLQHFKQHKPKRICKWDDSVMKEQPEELMCNSCN